MKSGNKNSKGQQSFTSISDVLKDYETKEDKYISREFQKYGIELAEELNDLKHKSLYIKLAKEEKRGLLEAAKRYVIDAKNAKNKGAMFMWKLKELKNEKKGKK